MENTKRPWVAPTLWEIDEVEAGACDICGQFCGEGHALAF